MNIFYLLVTIVYIIIFFILRRIIKSVILKPYKAQNYILIFDLFFISFPILIFFLRRNLFKNVLTLKIIEFGYIFLGVSWVLVTTFIIKIVFFRKEETVPSKERRKFLEKSLSLGSLGLISASAAKGYHQAFKPIIIKQDIKFSDKYPKLKGLKIAQISDLHIGPILQKDFLEEVVTMTNKLEADIVVITGDIADARAYEIQDDMSPLKNLKSRYGNFYILGNHEYYWGAEDWLSLLKELNFNVLLDENIQLTINDQKIAIGGIGDKASKRAGLNHKYDPQMAFKDVTSEYFKLLLAHRPKACYQCENLNIDLQLSGHTHGGQAFPWNIFVSLAQPYLKGLYSHNDTYLYVNRGTGFWGPPNRLMNQGEITEINFT